VREERSRTSTSFWRGNYESDPTMRQEFLAVAQRADV
jgi:GTP cyclohydrolase I